jgi:EAL domain-containing protein (putative c-di-GMP-specific phosphodiesterase class I)
VPRLTRFAFKKLQIDRFLLPHKADKRSKRSFSSVVAMAKELGLTVIAEGVETLRVDAVKPAATTGC